jgi:hypothetical protein
MCWGVHTEIQTPPHCNLIGCSITAPPPVIAEQYFSAISVALRSHSRKEEFGAPFENVVISIFSFF